MKASSLPIGLSESVVTGVEARPQTKSASNVIALPRTASPVLRVRRECVREDFLERIVFLTLLGSAVALVILAMAR